MAKNPKIKLARGDCLKKLKKLPDNSVDSVITDPPYGLSAPPDLKEVLEKWMADEEYNHSSKGFMNAEWDSFVPGPRVWKEVARVLKPGGTALVFAGTRTMDLMAVSLRLAGMIYKDTIMWAFGSGFPKSYNISKGLDRHFGVEREVVGKKKGRGSNAGTGRYNWNNENDKVDRRTYDETLPATDEPHLWQGWNSALKPAYEPILVFQNPLDGTYVNNALEHGVAGLNIDGCRIATNEETGRKNNCGPYESKRTWTTSKTGPQDSTGHGKGRWPANLVTDGSEEVVGLFPETGKSPSTYVRNADVLEGNVQFNPKSAGTIQSGFGDSGSAVRFFKQCDFDTEELIICRAKTIIEQWNQGIANTVDNLSSLPSERADSALSDVATWASPGVTLSSDLRERFTSVTPNELRQIVMLVITTILSIEKGCLLEWLRGRRFQTNSHVKYAERNAQTGTTTITIALSKSGGSVEDVTLTATSKNWGHGEADSASRIKYCAKASKRERDLGLHEAEEKIVNDGRKTPIDNPYQRGDSLRRNTHSTVKPISLMRYLARLTKTPTGGVVLDPFMGSGSTGIACMLESRDFIGVELNEEYFDIARTRIKFARSHPEKFDAKKPPKKKKEKNKKIDDKKIQGLWDNLE